MYTDNIKAITAFLVVIAISLFFTSFTVVNENQIGVHYEYGRLKQDQNGSPLRSAGLHWKLPLVSDIERVALYEIPVSISGLKPRMKDGFELEDMSFQFHYQMHPNFIVDALRHYSDAEHASGDDQEILPLQRYVARLASIEAEKASFSFSSREAFNNKHLLARLIETRLDVALNKINPSQRDGEKTFLISRFGIDNLAIEPQLAAKYNEEIYEASNSPAPALTRSMDVKDGIYIDSP